MDGKELAREVRRRYPGLPLVFATGHRISVPEDLASTGPTAMLRSHIGGPSWRR
jgi:hypothetical protein